MVSKGKKASSSHWAAKGLSSLSAKALAESRKASCCSVRSKFMVLTFLRLQIFEHLARKLKSASSPLSLLGRGAGGEGCGHGMTETFSCLRTQALSLTLSPGGRGNCTSGL